MKTPLLLAFLGVGTVAAAGVVAMSFGYFPGLSSSLGIGGPKDLGVVYTQADLASAQNKLDTAPTAMVLESFSDAELTALLNTCSFSTCFMDDVQVRTNPDGAFEFSGVVDRDQIEGHLVALSLSDEDLASAMTTLHVLPPQPSFYAKANVQGQDDTLIFNIHSASFANIPIPATVLDDVSAEVSRNITNYLTAMPGIQVRAIEVADEGVIIEADFSALPL